MSADKTRNQVNTVQVLLFLLLVVIIGTSVYLISEGRVQSERAKSESEVLLGNEKLLSEGVCPQSQVVEQCSARLVTFGLGSNTNRSRCKTLGCSIEPAYLEDVCLRYRREYKRSGRAYPGRLQLVQYDPKQTFDVVDYWVTRPMQNIKILDACYDGLEIKTLSSQILESVKKRSTEN